MCNRANRQPTTVKNMSNAMTHYTVLRPSAKREIGERSRNRIVMLAIESEFLNRGGEKEKED